MKTKWLWLLAPLALVVLAAALFRGSGAPGQVSARLVGRTFDSSGQAHIVYEITNGTSSAIDLSVSVLEAHHERTGWWDVYGWPTAWRMERTAGVAQNPGRATLHARSAAQLEILPPRFRSEGSALRGKVWHIKMEGKTAKQLRSIASRLGLPSRWLMWPKPGLADLPEAELAAAALPAAMPPVATVPQGTPAPPIASQPSGDILPAGCIKLHDVDLRTVLDIYAELADGRLEIDPRVRALNAKLSLETTQALARAGAVRLLEQALRQQAGVAVRRSETNCIEVTLDERPKGESAR
jgi:hypothetical protein